MNAVRKLGYPVPIVYSAKGPDMIMERLDGPTLADAVLGGSLPIEEGAAILAGLHDRLRGTDYVHLDLHPFNVMLTRAGPMVIDWRNARKGLPDLDLAATALILGMVALDPGHPAAARVGEFLESFLHKVSGDPLAEMAEALRRRQADPNLTADEKARLPEAARLVARHAVRLREVHEDDVETLYDIQAEPEGSVMAAVESRDRETFLAHFAKTQADPATIRRVILCGGHVAGDIGCWQQDGETLVGYRIGKRFWGRGIASRAVELFTGEVGARPLRAFVAVHNVGSIRVLEKGGFRPIGGPTTAADGVEEYRYELA
jgi:RimJ/RimL family protein N-acetyltransferase/tRNA A-37 threonylcarbamoyl transferase component Bud32